MGHFPDWRVKAGQKMGHFLDWRVKAGQKTMIAREDSAKLESTLSAGWADFDPNPYFSSTALCGPSLSERGLLSSRLVGPTGPDRFLPVELGQSYRGIFLRVEARVFS